MLEDSGFVAVEIGPAVDTFGEASGEGEGPDIRGVRLRLPDEEARVDAEPISADGLVTTTQCADPDDVATVRLD